MNDTETMLGWIESRILTVQKDALHSDFYKGQLHAYILVAEMMKAELRRKGAIA